MNVYKHPEVIKDILKLFQKRSKGFFLNPYTDEYEAYRSGLRFYQKDNGYFITQDEIKDEINIYKVLENICFGNNDYLTRSFIDRLKEVLKSDYINENMFSLPFIFAFYPELKEKKYNLFYYCLTQKDKEQIEKDKKFLEEINFTGLEERIVMFKKYYYHFH